MDDDDPRDQTNAALVALAEGYRTLYPAAPADDLLALARDAAEADPATFRAFVAGGQHLMTSLLKSGLDTATGTLARRRWEGVAPRAKGPQPPANATGRELLEWARQHGVR